MIMICGIDEAGRGPVIGPLVIAGVSSKESAVDRLTELGVKDSKKLSSKEREGLYETITKKYEFFSLKVFPVELDMLMARGVTINEIEAEKFAQILDRLKPRIAYIDSADANPRNFHKNILKSIQTESELVVEHRADENYPIVSAASIIAKVERDRVIEELNKRYRGLGSGYPSDPKTIRFLKVWFQKNHSFPDFVRKRWKTLESVTNTKIQDFYD